MKIAVAYSPDPVYMNPFILRICERYESQIAGVLETRGSITRRKNLSRKLTYFIALLLILGLRKTLQNSLIMLKDRLMHERAIERFCRSKGIAYAVADSINTDAAARFIQTLRPDILFNQSQHIVSSRMLELPLKGVLNRHGAFLPRYRGRLAPFWQLLNSEPYGGLTFHLLNEDIDDGPIVYQERIPIAAGDDFNTLVQKMFDVAVDRFGSALALLTPDDWRNNLIDNPRELATYHSYPGIRDALRYRCSRWL